MDIFKDEPGLRVPVLIVGAGPAGLASALLLRQYGVEALAVTRYGWTAHTPRAHHINPRAMELLRGLGLEEAVQARAMRRDLVANIVWCVNLAGRELARLATYHQGGARGYRDFSPCDAANIPQHHLEPVLAEALLSRGGGLLFNSECIRVLDTGTEVRAVVRNRLTGDETLIAADYLIGADGARSLVAEQIGLPFEGVTGWGAAINVWIRADLSRFCAHRPGVLYWTNLPGNDFWIGSGVFVAVQPWSEWMVTLMYDPRDGEIDADPTELTRRIHRIIGDDTVGVEIISVGKWLMNAQYAGRYSSGRVFCMGDAVHRHSPANGLGANTSMLDAYNLAWKLKLVLDGVASTDLLESYSQERQPIGRSVIERSMKSVQEFAMMAASIGYAPGQGVAEGEAQLATLAAPSPDGEALRARLDQALRQQSYQFNAVGFELGYRYDQGALWDAGEPAPNPDPDLLHVPQTTPGCALPHAWIVDRAGRRLSTLDIVAGGSFHLLTGPGGEAWRQDGDAILAAFGLTVVVRVIGPEQEFTDPYGQWRALRGVEDTGCVLVRPDGHVAWRAPCRDAAAAAALFAGIGRLLGKTPKQQIGRTA